MLYIVSLFVVGITLITHGNWMDKYRGVGGMPCCGDLDCTKVSARIVGFGRETTLVEVDGELLEIDAQAVHTSEDDYDWYCRRLKDKPVSQDNTRCVFVSVGS